jgi:hypothetical protein
MIDLNVQLFALNLALSIEGASSQHGRYLKRNMLTRSHRYRVCLSNTQHDVKQDGEYTKAPDFNGHDVAPAVPIGIPSAATWKLTRWKSHVSPRGCSTISRGVAA